MQPLPDQPSYAPEQVREIAGNILLFQRENGGWPKDYDMAAILTADQEAAVRATRSKADTSYDNGNLHSQVDYLARAYAPSSGTSSEPYLTRMVVKSSKSAAVVELSSVDWIEADGDYLELHAGAKVHLVRGTLSALEPRLDPREFVRIHRSTIVRISRVKELVPQLHGDYVVALSSGARLRLSRSYRARLGAALGAEL